ncbi:hypothetical protein 000TH008_33 [Bacillus phage 000TH008]|nr:hypothetical protein 000TH008_33 [Bacillus phage 000TH008]QQO40727.1 hypothetical protein 000TH009_33 [Bacillus phage 000TH009]
MRKLIHTLYEVLTMAKGFGAGYTTKTPDKMLINYSGKTYRIIIEEVQEEEQISDKSLESLQG